ncbi:hypothetical protein ACGFIX_33845 [Nocardia salmonicida]|uniref:hypothetical protein n=1 Tax=Nocardia salmonicida TaxID=53431 RepID=UPI003719A01E
MSDENLPGQCLVIPYFQSDVGHRPIDRKKNPSYIYYQCPYILLDGVNYTGEKLPRDRPIDLSVYVRNTGTKVARNVRTTLYWSTPNVGFVRPLNIVGVQYSPMVGIGDPPQVGLQTTWTVPPTVPEHICLLAQVSNTQDPAGPLAAFGRHYAQLNINLKSMKPGTTGVFNFSGVRRPGVEEFVDARSPEGWRLQTLGESIGMTPSRTRISEIAIENLGAVRMGYDDVEETSWQLSFFVPRTLQPGEFACIEIVSHDRSREQEIGGMALIVIAEDR